MTWPPHLPGQFEGEPDRELRAWLRRLPDADLANLSRATFDEIALRALGVDDAHLAARELGAAAVDLDVLMLDMELPELDLPHLADLIRRD